MSSTVREAPASPELPDSKKQKTEDVQVKSKYELEQSYHLLILDF
jgi:hypothetical protein